MRTLGLGLALLAVGMNGCAGGSAASGGPGAYSPAPESVVAEAPPPPPAVAAPGYAAGAGSWGGVSRGLEPAPAAPPRSESALPPPTERPGLGTEWGETRISRIHDVDFERADESRPFAVASIHYNDRHGVEALAAYHAYRGPRLRAEPVVGGAITVSVVDGGREPLEAIHLVDRTYVIGEQGERYAIVIANHSGHRVEAVASVDGLDVMNGKNGSLDYRGYVVDPYETITIDGFRQSQAAVAAFRFAKVADSYAAQTGSARNVGVIGVAFFDERNDAFARWTPWSADELRRRDTADPFPASDPRYAQPPARW
jgi:hypothetical protein